MPSLIDLRRRIRAVKSTQQITKAMKMVAASKLRRAQERIMNARPYAVQMHRVLSSVAARVDPSIHPLLTQRERTPESKTLVVVVTGDKGLCGSFNTNVIKAAEAALVGKGRLLVRKSGTEPLVRIMAEGDDEKLVRQVVGEVKSAVAEPDTAAGRCVAHALSDLRFAPAAEATTLRYPFVLR